MTAIEYYRNVFNPETLVAVDNEGLFELRESATSGSHVLITDKIIAAFYYDESFEHKKLLNPDKRKGLRQRHDFILLNEDRDTVEIFLIEMKSSKDDFSHLRNQLQGGIALMAFLQRMGIDKGGNISSFSKVRFYAIALFHTKQLKDCTDMEKLKKEIDKRKEEQQRYESILGVLCVENHRLSIAQLRSNSKEVSLEWEEVNAFMEFPS